MWKKSEYWQCKHRVSAGENMFKYLLGHIHCKKNTSFQFMGTGGQKFAFVSTGCLSCICEPKTTQRSDGRIILLCPSTELKEGSLTDSHSHVQRFRWRVSNGDTSRDERVWTPLNASVFIRRHAAFQSVKLPASAVRRLYCSVLVFRLGCSTRSPLSDPTGWGTCCFWREGPC